MIVQPRLPAKENFWHFTESGHGGQRPAGGSAFTSEGYAAIGDCVNELDRYHAPVMIVRPQSAKPGKRSPPTPSGLRRLAWLGIGVLAVVVLTVLFVRKPAGQGLAAVFFTTPPSDLLEPANDAQVFAAYAGSASCRDCHREAFERWATSHHALAERTLAPSLDRRFFDPSRTFTHASQTSATRANEPRLELRTAGPKGKPEWFACERVIGVDPLRQFLIPATGGRWQVTELAVDPRRGDWFVRARPSSATLWRSA